MAPTLNVEELDKRIAELKVVHFWLDQNSKALGATIQALEVQKMTLATLKGMNFNMGDVANALKLKAADSVLSGVYKVSEVAADSAKSLSERAQGGMEKKANTAPRKSSRKAPAKSATAPAADPLAWWGSLTQQFQQIASNAVKEAAAQTAVDTAKNLATGVAKETAKKARRAASGSTKKAK